MEWIGEIWRRLRALVRRRQNDRDLEEEMRLHVELRAEEQMKTGVAPDDARSTAQQRFGNALLMKERSCDVWGWRWLETFLQDLRYGARMLRKSPAFTAVAILSLAIGIGANTAIFSVVNAILLKSMPVRNPEQLRLVLWTGEPRIPMSTGSGYSTTLHNIEVHSSFSYPMYQLLATSVPQFSDVMGFAHADLTVLAAGESHYAGALFVTGNFFRGAGVNPLLGRMLSPEDDRAGAPAVAVIGYRYWERRFGLDRAIVGRTIRVNGRPVTIAGVIPKPFLGLEPREGNDLILPMALAEAYGRKEYSLGREDSWWVQILGRLRPGVPDRQAWGALDVVMARASARYEDKPEQKRHPWRPVVENGAGGVPMWRENASGPLFILSGVVAFVLLIACANLANLLLARGTARRREMAVRLSIGAGRWRLVRQLLTESLLLAGLGAGAGLTFASPLSKLVLALAGGKNPLTLDVQVDARTLLFTVATALLTALIFGLAPAFRATRINLTPSLKDGATGGFGATPHSRLSRSLIVGQVALSTLLLAGAGLFIRTLVNLAKVDPGFQSQQLLIFTVDGSRSGYEAGKLLAVYERIREKVSAIPGVRAATFSMFPLIAGSMSNSDISVPGYSPKGKESARTYEMVADSGFLAAMGIPILLGRDLNDGDTPNAPMVAVVNETFVRDYFAGNNPLGKIFYFGQLTGQPKAARDTVQIIGVCRDAKYTDLRSEIPPTAYLSYLQNADWVGRATFEVRTAVPPLSIANAVRRAVAETDRDVPVADLLTQEQQIRMSLSPERLAAGLIGSFGLIAALLAAIGLYGVMAYTVTRRTSEIGIRMALGAGCNAVLWMVLRGSLFMVATGIGIGVPTALAMTQVVREALYGIEPNDPVSFIAASVLMLAVATVAAWIPAQRAGRVDPMQALRHE